MLSPYAASASFSKPKNKHNAFTDTLIVLVFPQTGKSYSSNFTILIPEKISAIAPETPYMPTEPP